VTLVDVVNRGNMTVGVFHLNARRDLPPDSAGFYGDALLLRRGLTVVMLGWQWDILPGEGPLHFHPPVAGDSARPITGLVRSDITVDEPTRTIPLGHRVATSQALGYPVSDVRDPANALTVRDGPLAPRTVVPRTAWRFAREDEGGRVVDDPRSVYMAAGFQPGKIYEVIYRARDPVVVGTGLAAVRDMIAYLKYDSTSIAPTRRGIAYGVSQTGRLLRHFLYQGFNTDERGRPAFDGIFAHTAGAGRGSFNHRFAQPSRDAQPYSTFFYPTDLFPFTSPRQTDPQSGARDGLRTHAREDTPPPRVFYVDGGYEYWGRAASLTHTTVDGARDVGLLPTERRYVIASAQHSSPAPFPPADDARIGDGPAWRGNPLDQRLALRALLVALVEWVRDGREPPASVYPTRRSGLLTSADSVRFPAIPDVALARVPYRPHRLDLGSRWDEGIVDREPPAVGAPYTVLVPRVDSLGNELGGIRSVELRAPLATYFPWQLRTGAPAATDRLASFRGTFVPLPRTSAERARTGDPRPSIERLYPSRDAYLGKVDTAARQLIAARFLLAEDTAAVHARLAETWDWIMARRAQPAAGQPAAGQPAAGQPAAAVGTEGDFVMRDFRFTDGSVLPELRIHYTTLGRPRRDAAGTVRNAVLVLHGTTGNGRGFLGPAFAGELFGPGQLLDTATHYVILPDGIGTGRSTKPSDGLRARFPRYGYEDMVTAQYRLVTEGLKVDHLLLVMGTSMGGMQTWMWGERYPDFMDGLVPLASVPTQIAGRNRMMRTLISEGIRGDPEWRGGEYAAPPRGLFGALGMLFMMTSSPLQLHAAAPTRDSADAYITSWMRTRMASTDANDFLYQFEASRDYDPSPHLERIRAPVLAINSADDLVNPPELGLMERLMPRVRAPVGMST